MNPYLIILIFLLAIACPWLFWRYSQQNKKLNVLERTITQAAASQTPSENLPADLPGLEDLSYDLKIIAKRGIYMRFFFADTDPGYQILTEAAGQVVRRLRAKKKLTISFVPKANHTFATHQARSLLLRDIAAHFASRYVG